MPEAAFQRRTSSLDDASIRSLIDSSNRMDAVQKSGLLDAPEEASFDGVTRLAARLLKAPASFVSIVDADRDFYLSHSGFPSPLREERQMSGRTFCHFTLERDAPLVIDDTHADPQWKAVPTVQTLGVRAYVGVPIKLDGETIGSFCVIDMAPRTWSDDELEVISELAQSAAREIRLRAEVAAAKSEVRRAFAESQTLERTVTAVARDLRTPLQVLELNNSMLRSQLKGENDQVTALMADAIGAIKEAARAIAEPEAAEPVTAGARRLITTIELLQFSGEMLEQAAQLAKVKITMGFVAEGLVLVDHAQMLRAITNLVAHAIEHSPENGVVLLTASRHTGYLELTVSNSGAGVAEDDMPAAFEGRLGLVQELVVANRGTLRMTSEPGRGTTVYVALPCK